MEEGGIIGERRSRRSRVLLNATLEVAGIPLKVKLRNLSDVGALIQGDCLPAEGSNIFFRRDGLRLRGTVVWVDGQLAGIAFERSLKREELLRPVPPAPRTPRQSKVRRPGFGRPLTVEERRLLESWAAE